MQLGDGILGSTPLGGSQAPDVEAVYVYLPAGASTFSTPVSTLSEEANFPTLESTSDLGIPVYGSSKVIPSIAVPGYSSDGTYIIIPIASLAGLTSEEADAMTGDWREIFQAILTQAEKHARVYIDTPRSTRPVAYTIYKKDIYGKMLSSYFTVKFITNMGAPNVAPEP